MQQQQRLLEAELEFSGAYGAVIYFRYRKADSTAYAEYQKKQLLALNPA